MPEVPAQVVRRITDTRQPHLDVFMINSPFGANAITVGVGGDYPTIQSAIDYISTKSAFTQITISSSPTAITGWTQNTSTATTGAFSGPNTPGSENIWFLVTGDTYAYPLQSLDSAGPNILSRIPRIEATSGAANVTYYRENPFTVMLLDPFYSETVTINANIVVNFVGSGTIWEPATSSGGIVKGASFKYGKITIGDGLTINSGGAGAAPFISQNNGGWNVNNAIQFIFRPGSRHSNLLADSFSPPQVIFGSFEAYGSTFHQQSVSSLGHFFCISSLGDFIIQNCALEIDCDKVISFLAPDARFMDKCAGRKVVINGLNVIINDPLMRLSNVWIIAGIYVNNSDYYLSNIKVKSLYPSTTNIILVSEDAANAIAAVAAKVYISDCTLDTPLNTGTNKIYQAVTGSTATVLVNGSYGGAVDKPSAGTLTVSQVPLGSNTALGSVAAVLGNIPAGKTAAQNSWKAIILDDGSTGYIPVWK